MEAFTIAAAAHDVERAERLIEERRVLPDFRGAVTTLLDLLNRYRRACWMPGPSLVGEVCPVL